MRYVNLKKRNTSKFQYIAKRLASVSVMCMMMTAVVVVPLTTKAERVNAENNITNLTEENLGNDYLNLNNETAVDEVKL